MIMIVSNISNSKIPYSYWTWPFIVSFPIKKKNPIKNGDFP